ncbi:MAG: glycogen synthase GlgA [Oscillospiraceae bacterium]|jgi:starch synthase|nr:glycogen synthase GlgA [Oscillospiraceae bacterium]
MKVLYVTSECAPFVKTGGLADVMGALPRAVAAKRVSVRVMMPLYGSIGEQWRSQMKFVKYVYISLSWRNLYCGLFEMKKDGVVYYFLDNEYYFKRGELYGHFDDGERFAFFSKAAADILPELDWKPDVIHVNDWQTALVPVYVHKLYAGHPFYEDIRTVMTIHNIEYQGRYDRMLAGDIFGLPDSFVEDNTLAFMGGISLMRGGIECASAVTTVSPTYADELQYPFYAHGMEGVLAHNRHKLSGILNGIDMVLYDPKTDPNLEHNFGPDTLSDRVYNKLDLQKILGINQDETIPIIAMVSRLVGHKGLDLVTASLDAIMDMSVQLVVLGRGDWHYEQVFINAQNTYSGRLSASIMVNFGLAIKVFGGADIFLMPSQAEPCGLSQMMAMRYGAVPVVRETGGLRDTVRPYIPETGEGNGFTFANYNASDMQYVLGQAVETYHNKEAWAVLQKRNMGLDFGWSDSAAKYLTLYRNLTGKR